MQIFASDHHPLPLPPDHPFPGDKYALLRQRVESDPLLAVHPIRPAPAASTTQLLRVHGPDYVQRVAYGLLTKAELRRIGFPWSEELFRRSLHSVGGTIAAGHAAAADGIAANLAGGTHHAARSRGAGFCVFNDVMVAIRDLQAAGVIRRAVILDCDVHQGDGTAELAAGDPTVFTFSIHGANNFPVRKQPSDLDVALPNGTDEDAYLAALEPALRSSLDRAEADLVFYLAGADPFVGDRFGRLALSKEGLATRDQLVLEACRARQLPVALAMAGGYAKDLEDIVDIQVETLRIATAGGGRQ